MRTDRMRRGVGIVVVVSLLAAAAVTRAQIVDWLYDVEVVINERTAQARADAASEALGVALMRLTGLPEVPTVPSVAEALRHPDQYYVQYGFTEEQLDDERITRLRVRFAPNLLQRLVSEAGLPLWSANRPVLMIWAAVDGVDGVEILAADSLHPLAAALADHAKLRGLPIVLPAMDLDDEAAVSVDAVLGEVTAVLRDAAVRYGADGVLVLRVRGDETSRWRLAGRLALFDDERELAASRATVEEIAAAAVDPAVDALVARYAVRAGDRNVLALRVEGISEIGQYAALVQYLEQLDFVERVSVDRVEPHVLHVSLVTQTPWAQLKDLFDLDGRLVAMAAPFAPPESEIPMLWRDRTQ